MKPNPIHAGRTAGSVACCVAMLLALTACNKQDDGKTVGQSIDSGIAKTEQAAKEAKDKAAASMNSAGDAMKQASKDAQASGGQASTTLGEKIDDAAITASVSGGLAKDPDLSAIKINVDTKAGVVTLNGPAPTAAAKDKATEIAKQVKGVTAVNNQLIIKAS
jgi:hyperosmotically inducible periplasmic protein